MPVPTNPVLRAAARWLEHRTQSGDKQLHALFKAHPSFADITPTQYAAAYEWLKHNGLLKAPATADHSSRVVFEAAIREALWFADADLLVPEADSMPQDGMSAAEALGIAPVEAFALLRNCWGKVDTAERMRVGTAGEIALVSLLASMSDLQVEHVAAESDGYGYDINVAMPDNVLHIEVKTTTRRGRLSIYLSRNEFETMRRDAHWLLVVVRVNDALEPVAAATVDRGWIADAVPDDRPGARWESAKFDVPQCAIAAGIAPMRTYGASGAPLILLGDPDWPGP